VTFTTYCLLIYFTGSVFDNAKHWGDPNNVCLFRKCASMQNTTVASKKYSDIYKYEIPPKVFKYCCKYRTFESI